MSNIEKMLAAYNSQTSEAAPNEKEVVADSCCDCCETICNICICFTWCADGGCC